MSLRRARPRITTWRLTRGLGVAPDRRAAGRPERPGVADISGRSPTEARPDRVADRANPPDGPANRPWDRLRRDDRSHDDGDGRGCTDWSDRIARPRPRTDGARIPQHEPLTFRMEGITPIEAVVPVSEPPLGRGVPTKRTQEPLVGRTALPDTGGWGARIRQNEPTTFGVAWRTPIAGTLRRSREDRRDCRSRWIRPRWKNATAFPT